MRPVAWRDFFCLYRLYNAQFGRLILGKIVKMLSTDLRQKYAPISMWLGFRPRPGCESLQRSLRPIYLRLRGPLIRI